MASRNIDIRQPVAGPSSSSGTGSAGKKRRSNAGKACLNCRRRKTKCDGLPPTCKTCLVYNDDCAWGEEEDGRKSASRQFVSSLQNRIKVLESLLREKGQSIPDSGPAGGEEDDDDDEGNVRDEVDQTARTMLHLHMSEAGEEVHYHGPTSAFAHSDHVHILSTSPHAIKAEGMFNRPHDYRRYLPESIEISVAQHNIVLDRFFRFFASWGLRAFPDLFHQDMVRTVMLPPHIPPPRFTHYSPFLHNIILAIGLMWADDETLKDQKTRAVFAEQAEDYLAAELARPTLATVQGLALKSSYHSTLGDHSAGWAYYGMADRVALSLGLNVDCAPLVASGKVSKTEMLLRRNTFWTVFIQEQCWSVYIGRPHDTQEYNVPIPLVDQTLDDLPWRWDTMDIPESHLPPQPCLFSSAFMQTAKLMVIIKRIMTTLYSLRSDVAKLQRDNTISELGVLVDSWDHQLPPNLTVTGHSTRNALPHILMLQLAREWCTILIYRPFYRPMVSVSGSSKTSEKEPESPSAIAIRRCDRSAARINSLLRTYHTRFGLRFSPPTLFSIAFTAGTTHLLGATSHRMPKSESEAIGNAHECVGFLRSAAESWPAAGHKADILEALIRDYHHAPSSKVIVPRPIQTPSPAFQHQSITPEATSGSTPVAAWPIDLASSTIHTGFTPPVAEWFNQSYQSPSQQFASAPGATGIPQQTDSIGTNAFSPNWAAWLTAAYQQQPSPSHAQVSTAQLLSHNTNSTQNPNSSMHNLEQQGAAAAQSENQNQNQNNLDYSSLFGPSHLPFGFPTASSSVASVPTYFPEITDPLLRAMIDQLQSSNPSSTLPASQGSGSNINDNQMDHIRKLSSTSPSFGNTQWQHQAIPSPPISALSMQSFGQSQQTQQIQKSQNHQQIQPDLPPVQPIGSRSYTETPTFMGRERASSQSTNTGRYESGQQGWEGFFGSSHT